MQITYQITKKLQLELASEDKDAEIYRTFNIRNSDASYLIVNDERVRIDSAGDITLALDHQACYIDHRRVYAEDEDGWAGGRVHYKKYYIHDKDVKTCDSTPTFDFLIKDVKTLNMALDQIGVAECKALDKVDGLNREGLAAFPLEIKEFNEKRELKVMQDQEESIKRLRRSNSELRKEVEELQALLNSLTEESDED